MPSKSAVIASIFLAAAQAQAGSESAWRQTLAPHFDVHHEANWMPPGFLIAVERIHSRLRLDLAMFSPWMAKERIKLFLYASPESYAKGTWHPPAWSNGLAMYETRTVIVYDQASRKKLDEILAHETTHLLFESYWGEVGKRPPAWLNEGLAMLEEADSAEHPESSDWYQMMVDLPGQQVYSIEALAKITPTEELTDKSKVTTWYTESYSVVHFLFRKHSKLQFKTFVSDLRDGKSLERSLWLVYRYRSLGDFQKAWLAWLNSPTHRKRVEVLMARQRGSGEGGDAASGESGSEGAIKPIGAIEGFKPLKTGR